MATIKKYFGVLLIALVGHVYASEADKQNIQISVAVTVPKIDAAPYHKPYVAVWLETLERKPVATIAVWHEKDTWLKDMRQWWRKIGRKASSGAQEDVYQLDGLSGATRKPGEYTVHWPKSGAPALPPGEYLINIESSREEGGRSYLREKVIVGKNRTMALPAKPEIGPVTITTY